MHVPSELWHPAVPSSFLLIAPLLDVTGISNWIKIRTKVFAYATFIYANLVPSVYRRQIEWTIERLSKKVGTLDIMTISAT